MIKQECIGIPDMILLLMNFFVSKKKIKAEIVLSPGGAYFNQITARITPQNTRWNTHKTRKLLFCQPGTSKNILKRIF